MGITRFHMGITRLHRGITIIHSSAARRRWRRIVDSVHAALEKGLGDKYYTIKILLHYSKLKKIFLTDECGWV